MFKQTLLCCAVATLIISFGTSAFSATDDYKTFRIGVGNVSTPLSQGGGNFDISSLISEAGKDYPLSLAQAYCTFIYLTGIDSKLSNTGATPQLVSDIVMSLGPNQYIATGIQESALGRDSHSHPSGYLQIDNSLSDIVQNSGAVDNPALASYYGFLGNDDKAETVSFDNYCTSNIVKAYFDVISYMLYDPAVNMFAKKYAEIQAPGSSVNIGGQTYTFSSVLGLQRLIAYLYNQGQWQAKLGGPATDVFKGNGNVTFESKFTYNTASTGNCYVYQIPELYAQLETLVGNGHCYDELISNSDMVNYLGSLKYLYPADVIQTGISKVNELMQGKSLSFRSHEFFNVMSEVTKAMIEASRK
ncbi:hypothetical protein P0136_05085 [Lentisphaerota bacterium ZTH]|nr:hypothetical protein JYG24_03800 [Lentisphaerota bacterium]WET07365.1 hypothetical protein P0136_05085 [Lentisphaerota bacterium ZTH]